MLTPRTPEEDMGLPLRPGQRVLDLVDGLDGVVIGGRVEHTPPKQVIRVKLDIGPVIERTPDELLAYPAKLAVPLEHFERS